MVAAPTVGLVKRQGRSSRAIAGSVLIVALLALVSPVAHTRDAAAFIEGRACDDVVDTNYFYFGPGNGTDAQRSRVRAAAANWNKGLDYDASRLQGLFEGGGTGGNDIRINFTTRFDGTSTLGSVNAACDQLDIAQRLVDAELQSIALHEFGHFLGLQHTGVNDNFMNGDVTDTRPAMSTCTAPMQAYKQDDEAALGFLHSKLYPPSIVANMGFERGNTIWVRSNSSSVLTYKQDFSKAANGAYYVHFRNVAGSDTLYQTISYSSRNQTRSLQALANLRYPPTSYSPTASGQARVELVMRFVSYPSGGACVYPDGSDHNTRSTVGSFYIARTKACPLSYSWSVCATDAHAVDPQGEVKTRMYSDVKNSSGQLIGVEADDLRTRDIT